MKKIIATALREFKTTALTPAFFIGAVVMPIAIWAVIIAVTAADLGGKKDPMRGTIAVIDTTRDGIVAQGFEAAFDPEVQKANKEALAEKMSAQIDKAIAENPMVANQVTPDQLSMGKTLAMRYLGLDRVHEVEVERVDQSVDRQTLRDRVKNGELLAFINVGEYTIDLPNPDPNAKSASGTPAPGTFEIVHSKTLDPEYLGDVRSMAAGIIQDARYERRDIDPKVVDQVQDNAPRAKVSLVTDTGEEGKSNALMVEILPFIFMMLLFTATMTGGQYLLMGTLEEKGSRVMEVLLSAVSPGQLLIGKMIGQGLVGAAILVIYSSLGVAAADRFNMLSQLPLGHVPLLALYFIMAYAFLGGMMTAIGAAVTDYREANALFAPVTISMMLPFILLIIIKDNPSGMLARVTSYFPPTTPFVMAMRISQPAHPVPVWEIIATMVVGFAGVGVVVWGAAKIFRLGVLRYGKPPTLVGLMKWLTE
ncbi:MAG: ABC transporter permease [Phycisphaerales bacterium]|nr:ABC transporter permease [Phycisphaerales bacterium]